MDDVVVIILTLLIIGIGAINQFRKKRKEPLPENDAGDTPEQKNFWEEFMDVERGDTIPQPASEDDLKEAEKTDYKEKSAKQPDGLKPEQEGVRSIRDNTIKEMLKDLESKTENKKAHLPEGFTLRKAVIFSEILKPKYF